MASHYEAPIRRPLVTGDKTYHDVTVDVAAPVEGKANQPMVDCFRYCPYCIPMGIGCIAYTIGTGIGRLGLE